MQTDMVVKGIPDRAFGRAASHALLAWHVGGLTVQILDSKFHNLLILLPFFSSWSSAWYHSASM